MLKAWREIAQPHDDVLSGKFDQSTFAVSLSGVASGNANIGPEYRDAERFFARTYMTASMKQLLELVALRLCGKAGGQPVINLQTNFGGGKTHTLLAVWHLAGRGGGKVPLSRLQGVSPVLDRAGIKNLPLAKVAVIDGVNLGPNQSLMKDGMEIRTLWGRIAYQLGGIDAFAKIRNSDERGTSPGKDVFIEILQEAGPCVILMDELVAYLRQFIGVSETPLAGSYQANMTFMQVLAESVREAPNAQLLVSMQESAIQLAGPTGEEAMNCLRAILGRMNFVWRAGEASDGYEIVKRRLFSYIDAEARDQVCREYAEFYRKESARFPLEAREYDYERRLQSCFPFHPELFDRLYNDWSTLNGFQRTRGVLQLMAGVVYNLWTSNNQDPFIQPGAIPFSAKSVADLCVHLLGDGWAPVIDSEVDGPRAAVNTVDNMQPLFGQIQAAHRVARAIFLASAPASERGSHQGVDMDRLLLGTAIPGHRISSYEEALGKMNDSFQYLFKDEGGRSWYDKHPNLRKEAENIQEKLPRNKIDEAIRKQVSDACGRSGGAWSGIHVFARSEDVPDEIGNGFPLVVLRPEAGYDRANQKRAFDEAAQYLTWKGKDSRRIYANRLVFLAPSLNLTGRVETAAKQALAWRQIVDEVDSGRRLGLDGYQVKDAKDTARQTMEQLRRIVRDCYANVLVASQGQERGTFDFEARKISTSGNESLSDAAARLLKEEESIVDNWGGKSLQMHLAQKYFRNGQTEADARKVWEDMGKLMDFPRIHDKGVFERAVAEGVRNGLFGHAQGKTGDRYDVFAFNGPVGSMVVGSGCLLIEAKAAAEFSQRLDEERRAITPGPADSVNPPCPGPTPSNPSSPVAQPGPGTSHVAGDQKAMHRFFVSVDVGAVGGLNTISQIFEEIVSNLARSPRNIVTVKLDIEATSDAGFDAATMRSVRENMNSLNLNVSSGGSFEEE